eukprot:1136971-Pelagomonas_calceolata.AAC.5
MPPTGSKKKWERDENVHSTDFFSSSPSSFTSVQLWGLLTCHGSMGRQVGRRNRATLAIAMACITKRISHV